MNSYEEFHMRCSTGIQVQNPLAENMVVPKVLKIEFIEVDNPKWIQGILWRIFFGILYLMILPVVGTFIIGMVMWIDTPLMGFAATLTGFQIARLLFIIISSWVEFGNYPSWRRKLLKIKD